MIESTQAQNPGEYPWARDTKQIIEFVRKYLHDRARGSYRIYSVEFDKECVVATLYRVYLIFLDMRNRKKNRALIDGYWDELDRLAYEKIQRAKSLT